MTFLKRYRNYLVGLLLVLVIGGGCGTYFLLKQEKSKITMESYSYLEPKQEEIEKVEDDVKETYLTVDIKGAVMSPGIYAFEDNQRVMDAIVKAGGLQEQADTSVLNLSLRLEDEMVIYVYTKEEVANFTMVKVKKEEEQKQCLTPSGTDLKNDACQNNSSSPPKEVINGVVSLNQGTLEELMTLPGIGESKGKAILNYRNDKGSFKTIDEIMEVKGIGSSIFAKIKDLLTL